MNIIVLGSTGMLGRYMHYYLQSHHECRGLSRKDFDARDLGESDKKYFQEAIRDADFVINCVGVLKPYIDDVGVVDTIKINSVFPQMIADICENNHRTRFIHISSDCIYAGGKGGYVESDISDSQDIYAKTKSIEPVNSITLRTSFIGEDLNKDGVGLLEWLISQRGKTVDGYTNCIWNGVTCLQLAQVVNSIITGDDLMFVTPPAFTRHIFSPNKISKYDLCCIINDVYDLDLDIQKKVADSISGSLIHDVLDRSLSTQYSYSKLPDIRDQIVRQKHYSIK